MKRKDLIKKISDLIKSKSQRPFIVGIDGLSASGKTYFADELSDAITRSGESLLLSGMDGFLNPKEVRNSKGEFCPEGYYQDCFDYQYLADHFFRPIKENGATEVVEKKFDLLREKSTWSTAQIGADTIIVFEGVMLFRPEINEFFDLRIFVDVSLETSLKRGLERDSRRLEGASRAKEKYERRYLPGQKKYQELCKPEVICDIHINNEVFDSPELVKFP